MLFSTFFFGKNRHCILGRFVITETFSRDVIKINNGSLTETWAFIWAISLSAKIFLWNMKETCNDKRNCGTSKLQIKVANHRTETSPFINNLLFLIYAFRIALSLLGHFWDRYRVVGRPSTVGDSFTLDKSFRHSFIWK